MRGTGGAAHVAKKPAAIADKTVEKTTETRGDMNIVVSLDECHATRPSDIGQRGGR